MVAAIEKPRAIRIDWNAWGNYYTKRFIHEDGWPSLYASLRLYGDFQAAARILLKERPVSIILVDMALARLTREMRDCVVLWYVADRDSRGYEIPIKAKAQAMSMSERQYRETVRVAKQQAEKQLKHIDLSPDLPEYAK